MEKKPNSAPLGAILTNGDLTDRLNMLKQTFPVGTKFLFANYNFEQFRISSKDQTSGTEYRRMQSPLNDVIMSLSALQTEYANGNIKFLDEKGEIIEDK